MSALTLDIAQFKCGRGGVKTRGIGNDISDWCWIVRAVSAPLRPVLLALLLRWLRHRGDVGTEEVNTRPATADSRKWTAPRPTMGDNPPPEDGMKLCRSFIYDQIQGNQKKAFNVKILFLYSLH